MPDLTGIFYFALFGIACAIVLAVAAGGWSAYHIVMALAAYNGIAL